MRVAKDPLSNELFLIDLRGRKGALRCVGYRKLIFNDMIIFMRHARNVFMGGMY